MATFCRITGKARNLPKPCYFPLLPPISPADAKKLCRITGKANDLHHYSPIISFGKPIQFDGIVGCRITKHEDFSYLRPILLKCKENERSFDYLKEVLTKMKSKKKKKTDPDKFYVYHVDDQAAGLVIPPELEEAIRLGEFEFITLAKDNSHINLKIKEGRLVRLNAERIPQNEMQINLYYGEGQSKKALEHQQKVLNDRNKRKQDTMARKKVFEEKEQKAEEEEKKATQRPKPKPRKIKFDPQRRTEKMRKMEQNLMEQRGNKSIILPKYDPVSKVDPDEQLRYEQMLEDIKEAQIASVGITIFGNDFDWKEITTAESEGFDFSIFPHEKADEEIIPVEVKVIDIKPDIDITSTKVQSMDVVASVETVTSSSYVENAELIRVISMLEDGQLTNTTEVNAKFKKMKATKMLADITEMKELIEHSENMRHGFLVEKDKGVEFVPKDKYKPEKWRAVSGAMAKIEDGEKFIVGQIINVDQQETFVAGQSMQTKHGLKFTPGQTVVKNGVIDFIPGRMVLEDGKKNFVGGHIIDTEGGKQFKQGQMMDRGDGIQVFTPGQTVLTDEGPKFIPGEFTKDYEGNEEFVPGLIMSGKSGEEFIPGQVFQTEKGISFTPGQIIETDEGPSFIPGKSFKTSAGETIFVRGNISQSPEGKVHFNPKKQVIPSIKEDLLIPNEDLRPLAVPEGGVAGIVVNPINTENVQVGDKLHGSIVETEDSVLFYLEGKLPTDLNPNAKVISGQLVVGENTQKFIPGKMMTGPDGEKFVPGQKVSTIDGEEFIPGQLIETVDGPKFIPGQMIITSEGEKFVPGQVLLEKDGPKFVPGHVIHTRNGATFIPGQMMNTDEGQKFIPGQLVETKEGPMFVPGQVLETMEGPKFLPGTIVETEEGLKYVPSEADDQEDDLEISFQAFDISPEELLLITSPPEDTGENRIYSPIGDEQGLIDSSILKKIALDSMEIRGITPDPTTDKKQKKKKVGRVAFDAPAEETEESDTEDEDTEKIDVLKRLMKAESTVSKVKRERELRGILESLGKDSKSVSTAEVEALHYIIASRSDEKEMLNALLSNDEQIVGDVLSAISNIDNLQRNDQVKKVITSSLQSAITRRCDKKINDIIERLTDDPDSLFTDSRTQILLTEAVGIVCITGDVEVATLLEKFISEPDDPESLKEHKGVLAVLRQLLVLHEVAMHDAEVGMILMELQTDPEGIKNRDRVKSLIKKAKKYLRRKSVQDIKPFNIRHVASSKDIPSTVFEQLKEDKEEAEKFIEELPDELISAVMADKQYGERLLDNMDSTVSETSAKAIQKFRKGMVVVVTKENMQAVIPRHHARSVCYGIVPYLLIDEDGFKFFERGLTGRKLAPSRVIQNTWYEPNYYANGLLHSQQRLDTSGQEYSFYGLGNSSLQYTSLLPSDGPTKLSLQQRRASRESSVVSHRLSSNSTTPSRRSSVTSYDPYITSPLDGISRRSSISSHYTGLSRGVTPIREKATSNDVSCNGFNSNAVVPYMGVENEDELPSVSRSDTVINLLDKYSNFSLAKEFGDSKTSKRRDFKNKQDDDIGYVRSRSSVTPENSAFQHKLNGDLGTTDNYLKDISTKSNRKLGRPFSDIFETDEVDTPTGEMPAFPTSRRNSKSAANTNYSDLFDNDFDEDKYLSSLRESRGKDLAKKYAKQLEDVDDYLLPSTPKPYQKAMSEPYRKSSTRQLPLDEKCLEPKVSWPNVDLKAGKRRRRRYGEIEDELYKPSYNDDNRYDLPIPRRRENPLSRRKLDVSDDEDDDREATASLVRSYARPNPLGYSAGGNVPPYSRYGGNYSNSYNPYPPRGPPGPFAPTGNMGQPPGYMGYPGGPGPHPNMQGNYGPPHGPNNFGMSHHGPNNYGGPPMYGYGQSNYPSMGYNNSGMQNNPYQMGPQASQYQSNYGGNFGGYGTGGYRGGNYGSTYNSTPYSGSNYSSSSGNYPSSSGNYLPSSGKYSSSSYNGSNYGTGSGSAYSDPCGRSGTDGLFGSRGYGSGGLGTGRYSGSSSSGPCLSYLSDDDSDGGSTLVDTKSYSSKSKQRKLAEKLAKQYLNNDDDEDDD